MSPPPPQVQTSPDPDSFTVPEGFETLIGTGESILDQFQGLGLSTHAIMGLVFLGGLLLWLFGGKSLRIGFGLLGMLVGAQVGLIVPALVGYDTPPVIVAVTGAALGLLVGLVAFRFTVAWTMAVLLGVIGLFGAAMYFEVNPDWSAPTAAVEQQTGADPSPYEEIYEQYRRLREQADGRLPGEDSFLPSPEEAFPDDPEAQARYQARLESARDGARKLSEVFRSIREQLRPTWEKLPTRQKGAIIAVALAGNILGFAVGMLATKKSAMLITAFAGPLIWVPAAIWLGAAIGAPGMDHLPTQPLAWAVVWIVLSVAGVLIQWRRPKD